MKDDPFLSVDVFVFTCQKPGKSYHIHMERFEESQTLQMPKEKDVWETVERENPNIDAETLDRLKKDIDYVVDHARDEVSSSIKNNTISQMLREFSESHTESETLSVLASYIEAMPARDDSGLFYLLDTVRGADVLMKKDERKVPAFENLSAHLARTLTQGKIWEDDDRSCRGIIFGVLRDMPISAMTDEGKETILNSCTEFIDRIKVMRNNPRGFCIDDIAEALRFTHPEMNREERMTEAERIIFVETDDSGWPAENEYEDEDDWDDWHDNQYNEQFVNEEEKEQIKKCVADTLAVTGSFKDIPEKIVPVLNLHIFNDLIQGRGNYSEGDKEKMLKKFRSFIETEREAEASLFLPTIGVEVEVPSKFDVNNELCRATEELGIPKDSDESWEFSTDFSYSAHTQSALVHELIRGGFIETENDKEENGKKIRGSGDFSMHVNIGIYPEIQELLYKGDHQFRSKFENAADTLVNALTYGFTSPDRLDKRKTSSRLDISKDSESGKKKRSSREPNADLKTKRIEIRSLEVRDKTVYRLLSEAQLVGETLLSSFLEERSGANVDLSEVWEQFEKRVRDVLKRENINREDIDDDKEKAIEKLKRTNVRQEMRDALSEAAREAGYVIEKFKETPKAEERKEKSPPDSWMFGRI